MERLGIASSRSAMQFVTLADESLQMNFRSPQSIGSSLVTLVLYINDVDEIANRAVAACAKLAQPIAHMFYGDRAGTVEDPFGHIWHIPTHKEDLSPKNIKERAASHSSD
jgi:PhnB protein